MPAGPRTSLILLLLGAFAVVPLLALSAYLWRLGARALAEGRFPPAGTAMIRPAAVLTGSAGRRRARLFQGLAVVLGTGALIMGGLLWRLSRLLPHG